MIEISDEARRIHTSSIVIDAHVDTVVRWVHLDEDLGVETGSASRLWPRKHVPGDHDRLRSLASPAV